MNKVDGMNFPGLDVKSGMSRVMNKKELYIRLLKKFTDKDQWAELNAGLASGDQDTRIRAAHTLKGIAANLSITNVHDRAEELEMALKAGDEAKATEVLPAVKAAIDEAMVSIGMFVAS